MSDFLYTDSELQMDTQLILCIEECDNIISYSPVDTRLFIGWSLQHKDYFVRGRREVTATSNYVPYTFHCESARDLYDFIKLTMGQSQVNLILYNFNNIVSMELNEITYEFFENSMDKNYEISGYDNTNLKRSKMLKYLRVLRNTYNWEKM